MTAPAAAGTPHGQGPARADLQRERILRAARGCFERHGFHAAAMTDIASAAEMSPGLIYRYFPGKDAIVQAIIVQEMEQARCSLDAIVSAEDLTKGIVEAFERWSRPDGAGDGEAMSPALFVEMLAVGARDPAVAMAMRAADAEVRTSLEQALRRTLGVGGCEKQLCGAAVTLQCLLEGLLVRAIREPDLDRRQLRAAIDAVTETLRRAAGEPGVPGA